MESVIFVLSLVLVSYVGAGYIFRVWRLPFFFSSVLHSGIGFILIGIIVGPLCLGWLDSIRLDLFMAPASIILSWAGLMFGLQFRLDSLRLISRANFKMAVAESLIAFSAGVMFFIPARWLAPDKFLTVRESLPLVFALAAIASVSAPTAVSAVARRLKSHGMMARTLLYVSASDAFVGISIFGIALSFFRADGVSEGALMPGLFWLVLTLALGTLLAFLYHVLLRLRLSGNERLALAVGIVVIAAGVSTMIDVSPLFLSMVMGVVLTNFPETQDRFFRLLIVAERPIFGMMLIMAGAFWLGFDPLSLALGFMFVIVRALGKVIGARYAFRSVSIDMKGANMFGLSLTGQGGMAIAMALDFLSRYPGYMGELLISSIVIAFSINAFTGSYFVRNLLAAEGEGA